MRTILLLAIVLLPLIAHSAEPKAAAQAVKFISYDIDPKQPRNITICVRAAGKTAFVEVGGKIPGTKLKIEKLDRKERPRGDGVTMDQSEIVLRNTDTNATHTVPLYRAELKEQAGPK